MKICPNAKCSVFGHIVYTLATRCQVCKWDLKPPLPASEVAHPKATQEAASTA
jgi:rRNA maturation protein Nop10